NWTANSQIAALAAILADACLFDQAHERLAAAIQNGHFQVIDLHIRVIDAHRIKNAQQVLGGRDQHALAHQAGGVTDARHVTPTGGNLETLQIRPNENNSGGNRGGENSDMNGNAAMEADARGLTGTMEGRFKSHSSASSRN